jgi:hypothetical protein
MEGQACVDVYAIYIAIHIFLKKGSKKDILYIRWQHRIVRKLLVSIRPSPDYPNSTSTWLSCLSPDDGYKDARRQVH